MIKSIGQVFLFLGLRKSNVPYVAVWLWLYGVIYVV